MIVCEIDICCRIIAPPRKKKKKDEHKNFKSDTCDFGNSLSREHHTCGKCPSLLRSKFFFGTMYFDNIKHNIVMFISDCLQKSHKSECITQVRFCSRSQPATYFALNYATMFNFFNMIGEEKYVDNKIIRMVI